MGPAFPPAPFLRPSDLLPLTSRSPGRWPAAWRCSRPVVSRLPGLASPSPRCRVDRRASGPVRRGWDDCAMARRSSLSPSPTAWRFRDRSCLPPCSALRPSRHLPCGMCRVRPEAGRGSLQERSSVSASHAVSAVRFTVPLSAWQACFPISPRTIAAGSKTSEFCGVSEARSYRPVSSSAVSDHQKLRLATESRKRILGRLCTSRRRPGG